MLIRWPFIFALISAFCLPLAQAQPVEVLPTPSQTVRLNSPIAIANRDKACTVMPQDLGQSVWRGLLPLELKPHLKVAQVLAIDFHGCTLLFGRILIGSNFSDQMILLGDFHLQSERLAQVSYSRFGPSLKEQVQTMALSLSGQGPTLLPARLPVQIEALEN